VVSAALSSSSSCIQTALNTAACQDPPNPAPSPRKTPREKKDAYQAEINAMEARMKQMAANLRSLDERKSSSAAEAEERGKTRAQ
jgi:hypothetical protein